MRSSSGPESLARYLSRTLRVVGGAYPLAVGFIAATSMNLAGNFTDPCTRATVTSPRLHRLAQRLQHVPAELRQLVEEQNAVVRQRHLPRPRDASRRRPAPAPWPSGAACAPAAGPSAPRRPAAAPSPSKSASSPATPPASAAAESPGSAPPASTCPSPAGRPSAILCPPAQAMVIARLTASCPRTSAKSSVGRQLATPRTARPSSSYGSSGSCLVQERHRLRQRRDRVDLDPLDDRRLARVLLRQDHAAEPLLLGQQRQRQRRP